MNNTIISMLLILSMLISGCSSTPEVHEDELRATSEIIADEEGQDPDTAGEVAGQASRMLDMVKYTRYYSCNETDGGMRPYEPGSISVKYRIKKVFGSDSKMKYKTMEDKCVDGELREKYCRGRNPATARINCSQGCLNGECIGEPSAQEQAMYSEGGGCYSVRVGGCDQRARVCIITDDPVEAATAAKEAFNDKYSCDDATVETHSEGCRENPYDPCDITI